MLQGGQLRGWDGQLQSGTFAVVVFGLQQGVEAGELRLEQRQLGKVQVAVAAQALHQFQCLPTLQTLGGAAAIGAGQAAGAELDAAVPAGDHHCDPVEALAFDGREHRPPGRAAGFAVIAAAVLIADLPGPAVVRGAGVAGLLDKRLGLGRAADRRGLGEEATLANLFLVRAGRPEREGHQAWAGGVRPQPLRMI